MYYNILVKGGKIWDGQEFLSGDVLISNGLIEAVGQVGSVRPDFVFEASDKIIAPGLVDIHTHLRCISNEKFGVPPETVCFTNGVTSAVDAAGDGPGGRDVMDGALLDERVFILIPIKDDKADFESAEQRLSRFGSRVVGLKICFDASDDLLKTIAPLTQVCDYARELGLKVMVHSTGSPVPMKDLLNCLQLGDICTHAFHGGENSALEDDFASLKAAQRRGVVIDGGFAGHVHLDFEVLRAALKSGLVPDTISSDITRLSAFVRGGNYGLNLCMTIARALGMPEQEILSAVTFRAAKAVGQEACWGRLIPGRKANLTVLDYGQAPYDFKNTRWGSTLAGKQGYRCLLTVADGQVVYRRSEI